MNEDLLRAALAREARPRLGGFFAARVAANLPAASRLRWILIAYWIAAAAGIVAIVASHPIKLPVWSLLVLVPVTLGMIALWVPGRHRGIQKSHLKRR